MVFAVLSWGPLAKWNGRRTGQLLPFGVLDDLPVVNAALPSRLALVVAPVIGLLLAYTVDRLRADGRRGRAAAGGLAGRLRGGAAAAAAHPAADQRPRAGAGVRHRRRLAAVRPARRGAHPAAADPRRLLPTASAGRRTRWPTGRASSGIPAGFFLGPGGPDGRGRIGPPPRTFDALMDQAGRTGLVPIVTEGSIRLSRADLRYWGVRGGGARRPRCTAPSTTVDEDALRRTATALLGQPRAGGRRLAVAVPPA